MMMSAKKNRVLVRRGRTFGCEGRGGRVMGAVWPMVCLCLGVSLAVGAEGGKGLPVEKVTRAERVDFQREILPVFQKNCLACHNRTKAKADLVLETPAEVLKGGESGPGMVPKKASESLIFKLSAHLDKPIMPPKDNKVEAVPLTPEQLGLLEAWIDQGGLGEVRGSAPASWQPLPAVVQPIYSLSLTAEGEWAACGRGNRLFVYHLPTRQLESELTRGDGKPAHTDLVHSVDFSPDGKRLASGDFGKVHLWRLEQTNRVEASRPWEGMVRFVSASMTGNESIVGFKNDTARLWNLKTDEAVASMDSVWAGVELAAISGDGRRAVTLHTNQWLRWWDIPSGGMIAELAMTHEVSELAMSSRGDVAVVTGNHGEIQPYRLGAEAAPKPVLMTALAGVPGPVSQLKSIPSEAPLFVVAASDKKIRIWEAGKPEVRHTVAMNAAVVSVAVSPDGTRIGCALEDGTVKLVRVEDASVLAELRDNREVRMQEEHLERRVTWAKADVDFRKAGLEEARKREKAEAEFLTKSNEERLKSEKAYAEKQKGVIAALEARAAAQKLPAEVAAEIAQTKAKIAELDAPWIVAQKDLDQARERLASAEGSLKRIREGATSASTPEMKAVLEKLIEDSVKLVEFGKAVVGRQKDDMAARKKSVDEARAPMDKKLQESLEREKGIAAKLEAATKAVEQAQKEAEDALGLKRSFENQVASAERASKKASELVPASEALLKEAEQAHAERKKEWEVVSKVAGAGSAQGIRLVAFVQRGQVLAGASSDGRVVRWSAEDGRGMSELRVNTEEMGAVVALLPGSQTGTPQQPGAMNWVSAGGKRSRVVPERRWVWERSLAGAGDLGLEGRVNAVKFSRDGLTLATGAGEPSRSGDLKLWKVADGSLVRAWTNAHSDVVLGLDFSPDGKSLASSGADRFAKVWSLADGKLERTLEGHTHHVMNVSWRPDGRTLASAGADKVVKLWNVMTGEQKRTLGGAGKEVTSVRFLEVNGDLLASSADGLMRWMNDEGKMVRSFEGASDYVQAGAVTPNGKVVIAGGDKGTLWFWDGNTGKLVASFAPAAVPAP